MKSLRKIIALLLALIFVLTCATACDFFEDESEETDTADIDSTSDTSDTSDTNDTSDTSSEDSDETDETKKNNSNVKDNAVKNANLQKYKIVIPSNASSSIRFAAEGIMPAITAKWKTSNTEVFEASSSSSAYEVLIGDTGKSESNSFISTLKKGEGGYTVIGTKIVIAGYSDLETIAALNRFYVQVVALYGTAATYYITDEKAYKADLADEISIMSFNVYVGIESDTKKAKTVTDLIRVYNPDIFGVQEASYAWQTRLKNIFGSEYEIIGKGRGTQNGEASLIFIRKNKFQVLSSGTKWLTDTPDTVSTLPGSELPRIVTYASLKTSTGKMLNYANTHLDHAGDVSVRTAQVNYLDRIIKDNLDESLLTFITGDFNMTPDQEAYERIKELGYQNSSEIAERAFSASTLGTWYSSVIDFCFALNNNKNVDIYKVVKEAFLPNESDHNPLFITVKI